MKPKLLRIILIRKSTLLKWKFRSCTHCRYQIYVYLWKFYVGNLWVENKLFFTARCNTFCSAMVKRTLNHVVRRGAKIVSLPYFGAQLNCHSIHSVKSTPLNWLCIIFLMSVHSKILANVQTFAIGTYAIFIDHISRRNQHKILAFQRVLSRACSPVSAFWLANCFSGERSTRDHLMNT